jgi:hypothetical protein
MDNTEAISNMIDDILAGNNTEAKEVFDNIVSNKMTDALDVRKTELAQAIYSNEKVEDEDEVEDEETSN